MANEVAVIGFSRYREAAFLPTKCGGFPRIQVVTRIISP